MQSSHDGEEFAVVDGVILLDVTKFLGRETKRASWSWLLLSIGQCDRFVALVQDSSSGYLRGVNLQFELSR